jgi:DNA adenine methylase
MAEEQIIVKPFLKWVGGKTQLLSQLLPLYPTTINNYYEIFLGGGSTLLALLSLIKQGKITHTGSTIYAFDTNEPLINLYINIQSQFEFLFTEIKKLIDIYNVCPNGEKGSKYRATTLDEAKTSKETYYFWIRQQYNTHPNKNSVECSAMFLFLNKTCFRGLFRMGPNGFNVPFGNYNNPEIVNYDHLNEIRQLIQNVRFECCDFRNSIQKVIQNFNLNDFVYMDPPYYPETDKSFVGYTGDGFTEKDHNDLFTLAHKMNSTNIKWMMSNSFVNKIVKEFETYQTKKISCKRSINSKKPNSKTFEIIIMNYEL